MPLVAAVSTEDAGYPDRLKLTPEPGFTTETLADWANNYLSPGLTALCDGLACFASAIAAYWRHIPHVAGGRYADELPEFR